MRCTAVSLAVVEIFRCRRIHSTHASYLCCSGTVASFSSRLVRSFLQRPRFQCRSFQADYERTNTRVGTVPSALVICTSPSCLDSETLTLVGWHASRCNSCGSALRHNFVWLGGQKIICMTFRQMQRAGVYFVTQKACFTMKYLHLCYLRILRAKTSPGQEAAVRLLADPDHPLQFWQERSLRDNLLPHHRGLRQSQE